VNCVNNDYIIFGLQGKVFRGEARQLKLNLEFIVACRHLDIVGGFIKSGTAN
jgi:hypothetical protein